MPSWYRSAFFLLLVLLLCACGGGVEPSVDGATPVPAEDRPVGMEIGHRAPAFTLPRLDGEGEIALEALRGKVVVVTFWASWCGPCRKEIPALESAWSKLEEKDAVILGVSVDDTKDRADGFLKMFPVTYPMVFDAGGGKVGNTWGARSIPMTVLVDQRGIIRRKHLGYTPSQVQGVVQEVEELLREKS